MAQPSPIDMNPKQQQERAGCNGTGGYEALRLKTWAEQSLEEKIELLRQQLKDFILREMREQIAILMQHQHGPNGELLAPLRRLGEFGQSSYDPLA